MSDHASDNVLRELALLSALESVNAKVDTSAIAEIKDWWEAVGGKFYGAEVERSLPDIDHPVAVNAPNFSTRTGSADMNYAGMTAIELVPTCLSSQNEAAWTEFVRRYQRLIARVIIKRLSGMGYSRLSLVDDLVQETFIKLFANDFRVLKNFKMESEQAFHSFLKVVAGSVATDYFRYATSAQKSENSQTPLDSIEIAMNKPSGSERNALIQEIDRMLQINSQSLHFERDYKIFQLYYGEGMTAKEISDLPDLGLTVKGVESALLRMTQLIRNRFSSTAEKKVPKKR